MPTATNDVLDRTLFHYSVFVIERIKQKSRAIKIYLTDKQPLTFFGTGLGIYQPAMLTKKTKLKKGLSKTIIIVFGVIIAILMSLTSPLFADNLITASSERIMEPVKADPSEPHTKEAKDENIKLHSTALLFYVFTKNLPFLNTK